MTRDRIGDTSTVPSGLNLMSTLQPAHEGMENTCGGVRKIKVGTLERVQRIGGGREGSEGSEGGERGWRGGGVGTVKGAEGSIGSGQHKERK